MIELLALASVAAVAPPETELHAIVIAHNEARDASLRPLRYADDDGARYFELLSTVVTNVDLLSVLDPETQRLHPTAAAAARVPSRDELDAALERTFRRIREARAAGRRTVFYFIYVGHGSVGDDGQGQIHLSDGRFNRHDLYERVLSKSPATINHVIVDACNAYFMVAKRGASDDDPYQRALSGFLAKEDLSAYPNTGVFLSTSMAAEVHEWSRYSAGIFSHELRSALTGGADVDLDGAVTYGEALAFVTAANARIQNPRARLAVFGRPPKIRLDEPLLSLQAAPHAPELLVPKTHAGRYYLEDGRGVRYADFHSAPDADVRLMLVPSDVYYLRSEDREIRIPTQVARRIRADQLPVQRITLAARGSAVDEFKRRLFSVAFGPAYFAGYSASLTPAGPDESLVLEPPPRAGWRAKHTAAVILAGGAVGTLTAAIILGSMSATSADRYRTSIGDDDDVEVIRGESRDQALAANILYGTAGALLTAGIVAWLWPDE